MDLTAVHEILEKIGYKDDEGIANEVCHSLYLMIHFAGVKNVMPDSVKWEN